MNKNKVKSNIITKNSVLSDHKRIRKKFIPPFLQSGDFEEVSWIDYVLPELLWLGIINESNDLKVGADLALSLASEADKVNKTPKKIWFAPASSYSIFTINQKKKIIKGLRLSGKIDRLKRAFLPLGKFYPECPLNFIFEDQLPNVKNTQEMLEKFKRVLSKFFDKRGTPATFIQANAIYVAFCTDMLVVDRKTVLANFPAIDKFPFTEESQRIASAIRASINVFFGAYQHVGKFSWPKYFWNRGLELQPCDYGKGKRRK